MGHVQLDGVEADPHGALRRSREGAAHTREIIRRHGARGVPAGPERQRRRPKGCPRVLARFQGAAALPRPLHGGFAARMGKLDAELCGPGAAAEIDDALERCFGFVGIKRHAAMGDAAVALHMGRLDNDEAGARVRQHAEMGKVPIGGATINGAVLAHGGHDDAILEFDAAEPDWRKQDAWHDMRTA